MTESGEPNVPEQMQSEIQTLHPGIAGEIEGAIQTLRKLQRIAGPAAPGPPAVPVADDAALVATTDGPGAPPAGPARGIGLSRSTDTAGGPEGGREAPVLAASETFGRYQIVRLLGRGAMGSVYLAYDSQLQRHVALKMPSLENNPLTVERFLREARAAAQLRSPYVCPVYDVGQISGIYYLSMAFIDGQPLGRVMAEKRLKNGEAVADVTAKIARGLQKAHEAGIIHRDLKPDNIMIDADGMPIVMDFGLARRLDDDIQLTAPGRILGTPAYMSPEQVEGDPAKIGPATDIYSLGAVLYQMLTDRLPFQGSLTSVLRQIGSAEPPRPSEINAAVDVDSPLEQICVKMMAKASADRYASMAEVAHALETAYDHANVPAAKPSVWQRLRSWFAGGSRDKAREAPSAGAPASDPLAKTSADLSQMPSVARKETPDASQTVDVRQVGDS